MSTMTENKTLDGKTADEWRAQAKDCRRREAESWERSDTDGFLSQWALTQMASRYDHCARIAEQGGIYVDAPVMLETGQVVQGEWVSGEYGDSFYAWEVINGQRYFNPSQAKSDARRRANDEKKGIEMHTFFAPATVNHRTGRPEATTGEWVDRGHAYGDTEKKGA